MIRGQNTKQVEASDLERYWRKILPLIKDQRVTLYQNQSRVTLSGYTIRDWKITNQPFSLVLVTAQEQILVNADEPWLVQGYPAD